MEKSKQIVKHSTRYGIMVVQTDAPFYISGSQVTGKINVVIKEAYPAHKLKLRIEGKEYCRFYQTQSHQPFHEGQTHTYSSTTKHHHHDTILHHEVIIYDFHKKSINPGQYEFPFSFYLPEECPSSTYYSGDHAALGVITYKCTGIFETSIEGDHHPIHNRCNLVVRQTKMEVKPHFQSSCDQQVNSCMC